MTFLGIENIILGHKGLQIYPMPLHERCDFYPIQSFENLIL